MKGKFFLTLLENNVFYQLISLKFDADFLIVELKNNNKIKYSQITDNGVYPLSLSFRGFVLSPPSPTLKVGGPSLCASISIRSLQIN